jgi:hypothetical protein
MFDKTQYKVLIEQYMETYQVSYTSAIHLMSMDQITDDYNISITQYIYGCNTRPRGCKRLNYY